VCISLCHTTNLVDMKIQNNAILTLDEWFESPISSEINSVYADVAVGVITYKKHLVYRIKFQ